MLGKKPIEHYESLITLKEYDPKFLKREKTVFGEMSLLIVRLSNLLEENKNTITAKKLMRLLSRHHSFRFDRTDLKMMDPGPSKFNSKCAKILEKVPCIKRFTLELRKQE